MEGQFLNLEQPTDKPEDKKPEEIKKRLKISSERIGKAEEEVMKRHIANLVKEVTAGPSDIKITEEDMNYLLEDQEIVELSEEIFKLENQSQTIIEEGGYTNKEKAKLKRDQLASLIERNVSTFKKGKAA